MSRLELEQAYRIYFVDIRKYDPFPMTLDYQSVLEFCEWLMKGNG